MINNKFHININNKSTITIIIHNNSINNHMIINKIHNIYR